MMLVMVERSAAEKRKAFGDALAEALTVRGITQVELGKALGGLTQSTVSAWKSGDTEPTPDTVFKIEKTLDLPPGHLSRHLGYLPPNISETGHTFEDVVMSDPLLDDPKKRGLLAMYREFTRRTGGGRRRTK